MNSESSSIFPKDWTPHLQRREPSEFAHVLRDEVSDLYAALSEVRFVVVQQSGDCFSNCDVWLYFEMCGWDDALMKDLVYRELALKELNAASGTCFSVHYMPFVLPGIDPPLMECCQ